MDKLIHNGYKATISNDGAEIMGHAVDGWLDLAPEQDVCCCDTFDMYNEADREAIRKLEANNDDAV